MGCGQSAPSAGPEYGQYSTLGYRQHTMIDVYDSKDVPKIVIHSGRSSARSRKSSKHSAKSVSVLLGCHFYSNPTVVQPETSPVRLYIDMIVTTPP